MKKLNICKKCGKYTKNASFCNRICAGRNQERQKHYCKGCEIQISDGWTAQKYCDLCRYSPLNPNYRNWETTTLQFLYNKLPKFQYHARIRAKARDVCKKSGKLSNCQKCGYSNHVEVCHIKPIAAFDLNTVVARVNEITNLVCLCPNCHWELDHGLFLITDLGVEPSK